MEVSIKELKQGTFFIHENKIKLKKWIVGDKHLVTTITMDLNQNSINGILMHDNNIVEINADEKVELFNISNWKLSVFLQSRSHWFLVNCNDFTFFNFTKVDEAENKILNQFELNPEINKNQFYLGEITLTIKNGKMDYDSLKFEKNFNSQSEIEKINFLLLKEINDKENLQFKKEYIFNNMFANNDFFSYINKIKEELSLGEPTIDFNLWKSLNLLSFSVIESDFYTALINIRQIRNVIFDFIYENVFEVQNWNAKVLGNNLEKRIEILKKIQSRPHIIDDAFLNIDQETKQLEKKLKDLEKWNKKYEKDKKKQSWRAMSEEWNFYHLEPIYYANMPFESIDQYLTKISQISNAKVFQYITKEILLDESQQLNWKRANYLTNNSVHKNNYDTERFQSWFLSKNELDILKKTLTIYIDVFKIFKEKHLGAYSKIYNFNEINKKQNASNFNTKK